MRNNLLIIFASIIFLLSGCQPESLELYISPNGQPDNEGSKESPFSSVQDALAEVEKFQGIQATIHMASGEYRLDAPIEISPKMNGVKIIGAGEVVVKGSKVLDLNWNQYEGQIMVADVSKQANFDQFYVSGKQQILARYPNYDEEGGHWQGHAADAIDPVRIQGWKDPVGAIVHAMHSGEWGDFHYTITGLKENGEPVLSGGHQNNRPSAMHEKYRMVENVLEELDSSGEWYLSDDNKLYYWPTEGIDIEKAVFEGVTQKHLINILGIEDNPVKNVTIEGIRFEHAQRTFMEKYEPLLRSDWTMYRGGAVFIEGAENVSIKNCEFTNLGGNVIVVSRYNRGVEIRGNHIHDCGATGITFVGDPSAVRSPSFQYSQFVPIAEMDTVKGPANNQYPAQCVVDDNLIYRTGRIEKQTAGVQISMAMDITVSYNSIYEVPRAGINISEGTWGGHIIEFNDVFDTVLESGDHGSFNSWGRDRFWHPDRGRLDQLTDSLPDMPKWDAIHTTIIRNNRFRCDHGWDIDLDDGSSNYKIYNNLCLNGGIKLREGFYRTVENNVMVNNGFHPHVWFKNSEDVFRRNIVLSGHADIRLSGWGKEVDYNLFPDEVALKDAQSKGVDQHSAYGDPLFIDAGHGNFNVREESPALSIGFNYFPMDDFGVKRSALKQIAKTPFIPLVWSVSDNSSKSLKMNWLGAEIKNIETMAERSASGLSKTAGVLILTIDENSVVSNSDIQVGDVVISCEGVEIEGIQGLMKAYQVHNWKGRLNLKVFRNQKSMPLVLHTKK
ncbi:PDZ domain-containing protein [Reichenbachiella sp. MALMAid0571]|uniref:PDZ domain-containing protein n=1 Tax=Reichenbachiella sp. MALMAid0571 TaxID=3143939 RepID=UPI0032DE5293